MSIKEELHDLVEQLSDYDAASTLALLRENIPNGVEPDTPIPLLQRDGPLVVSGRAFFNTPSKTLAERIAEQGVKPIQALKILEEISGQRTRGWMIS